MTKETIRPNFSLHSVAQQWLKTCITAIEVHTQKDVLAIYGEIVPNLDLRLRMAIEEVQEKRDTLLVILETPGGRVEEVRNIVNTLRHYYDFVHFLIPVRAMSAGTVLALSGDKIYMDYFSRLGPIDPQFDNGVPALSYLRQYEDLVKKSKDEDLSAAEYALLVKLDLAELHRIKLAADLSVSLIKDWLVQYKFKDWDKSLDVKEERAQEIAQALGDHQKWYTHGSSIHKDILEQDLRLKIDDYSEDGELKQAVWTYFWSLAEYAGRIENDALIHNKEFI